MLFFNQRRDLSRAYQSWSEENSVTDCSFSVISFLTINNLLDEDKAKEFLRSGKEGVAAMVTSDDEAPGLKKCTCGGFPKRILVAVPDRKELHYGYECCNCGKRSLHAPHRVLAKENWNAAIV